ncbi:MAG TPA: NAD(P)H-dependent glycerol-3-phosphate dehydrogenase [Dermatophilaceae bacterium]|nr:NAD(P)H-dependent glycerol-3-phosphate dehydrogenase [Dermatophilaceae bacterium]
MTRATRAAVMGTGSWGTAFAATLADAGTTVTMWGRRPESVEQVNAGCNTDYLPDLQLPDTIRATTDPAQALDGADVVVLAVPSQTLREHLGQWASFLPGGAAVVSLMKGVELGTNLRMSQVIAEVGGVAEERIVVLSGPNLAREIAGKQPAASVVACVDHDTADRVAAACATDYFRPYTETDVVGTELGGAVKNVVALSVGMAEGMGMGDNTKATLITRGLAETARLGARLGAQPVTFMGLAGVGDLIATCMSPLSRNRTFGENLGKGLTVEQTVALTRQLAEGVKSCHSVRDLAAVHDVEMPITDAVVAVIVGERTPREVVSMLMTRSRKHERH